MKIKLVYASKTGHSTKISKEIANEFNIDAENIKNNPSIKEVDLLIIVGGIYGGKSLPEMIEFAKKLDKENVKKVILITSCVSKKQAQSEIREILSEKGIEVVDEFICQGSFLFVGFRHPNKSDLQNAVNFCKKIIS